MSQASSTITIDRGLVLRAQDGDVAAFEDLVDRCQGPLFRLAISTLRNRSDAEDVVQESLLTAWRRLHLLEDPDAFVPWLLRICSRSATDLQRRGARRGTTPTDPADFPDSPGPSSDDPLSHIVIDEQMRTLASLLDGLDPGLRACWVLRETEGLSYTDIATALNLTESTVRGRLSRARTHITSRMEEWR